MILLTFHHTLTCPLFTSGSIRDASGEIIPYAVTPTTNMLPAGRYRIMLCFNAKERGRQIAIAPLSPSPSLPVREGVRSPLTDASDPAIARTSSSPNGGGWVGAILPGHSFRSAKGTPAIIIGEELIPGAVINGREYYDRLFERIEKAEQRHDPVELIITHTNVRQRKTPRHWSPRSPLNL